MALDAQIIPMPELEWKRSPCCKCGARTERQAETMCKPSQDETGEYNCPGEFKNGWSVEPTKESIARLDAWCSAQAAADDAAEARTDMEAGR